MPGKNANQFHLHRHLARLVGVEVGGHVGVGVPGRRAALEQLLVELERFDRFGRVDEALHLVGVLGVLILEAPGIQRRGHAHGDALGAALGVHRRAIDGLAVDLAPLEELRDVHKLVPVLGYGERAAVFGLERLLDFRPREPVLAVDPGERVAHSRQRPVLGLALGPGRIVVNGRGQEVVHGDAFLREEVVEPDVVPVLGAGAQPLAVADHQVAQLAARVELVEKAVGEAGPRHELELHLNAALGGEVLGQFGQRVGRVPGRPAERQLLVLRVRDVAREGERGRSANQGESGSDHRRVLPNLAPDRVRPPRRRGLTGRRFTELTKLN